MSIDTLSDRPGSFCKYFYKSINAIRKGCYKIQEKLARHQCLHLGYETEYASEHKINHKFTVDLNGHLAPRVQMLS